jgi:hypothetical protein
MEVAGQPLALLLRGLSRLSRVQQLVLDRCRHVVRHSLGEAALWTCVLPNVDNNLTHVQ